MAYTPIGKWRTLQAGGDAYEYMSLQAVREAGLADIDRLPVSLKILLESLLRNEDGHRVTAAHVHALAQWTQHRQAGAEIPFHPVRVLLPESSGIPLLADLAAMRDAMQALGGDPKRVNPQIPIDLVIDHSVTVEHAGHPDALRLNMAIELERNAERYAFLRWAQQAFDNFRLVPPGNGILHQMNLEVLATVVRELRRDGRRLAVPDAMVGMDSHTPMINCMGVLGWGVGGIEAAAAMLGQPMQIRIPEVIGCRLVGRAGPGVTTTDVVLTLTQALRRRGVVAAFVEFCGPGIATLALPQRATLSNMAVEYGATMAYFPIDGETLRYLRLTGRSPAQVDLVEAYAKAQGLWHDVGAQEPLFSDVVEFDLGAVEPCLAGPRRPEDRVPLSQVAVNFDEALASMRGGAASAAAATTAATTTAATTTAAPPATSTTQTDPAAQPTARPDRDDAPFPPLTDGDVVIAAITSCTNTSNPSVLMAAGLLARNAVSKGLRAKPWVKTSLTPGSRIVTDYLAKAGLQQALDALGFQPAGYGCTTCMGNSGPLDERIARQIEARKLIVTAVLSGNRNFESRIHPLARTNYLASPPLVVAYAIAGTVRIDLSREPLGRGSDGQPVYLRDIWPADEEVNEAVASIVTRDLFLARYRNGFSGSEQWDRLPSAQGDAFAWPAHSTYIRRPPFFDGQTLTPPPVADIVAARPLLMLADSITTDHISPIGAIAEDSPAGRYLVQQGVRPADFSFYGARRVNHEVMIRGTFANPQIRNALVPGSEGGVTRHLPDGRTMSVFEAAMAYQAEGVTVIIVAGKDYGLGSSRDWAAKGTALLGVRAVIAESFERIHRANLVGMGVLPLELPQGVTHKTLRLTGDETFTVTGLSAITPLMTVQCRIVGSDGTMQTVPLTVRVDTAVEADWYRSGGVLNYVLLQLLGPTRIEARSCTV